MRKTRLGLALLLCGALARGDSDPHGPVQLLLGGLTEGYLEPCGCGGQNAGGLARRAAALAELRRQYRGTVVVDLGGLGVVESRLPVIVRALAQMGVDVCGLSGDDLSHWRVVRAEAERAGLLLTSVVPPVTRAEPPPAPPTRAVVGPPGGPRVGVVSVAFGHLSLGNLTDLCDRELRALVGEERCAATVLISHLGRAATARLLERLTIRPTLVALATGDNEPLPAWRTDGVWWVPVARRGRSLTRVALDPAADQLVLEIAPMLLGAGPIDPRVQGWVDDYYVRLRAGQDLAPADDRPPSFPLPETCVPCHEAAVVAWRAHPHAHAVETLERIGRDVAGCLGCHAESTRADGRRPPRDGDRGVQCASCHRSLAEHLADSRTLPASAEEESCVACHNQEHSPGWSWPTYRESVVAACRGEQGDRR